MTSHQLLFVLPLVIAGVGFPILWFSGYRPPAWVKRASPYIYGILATAIVILALFGRRL